MDDRNRNPDPLRATQSNRKIYMTIEDGRRGGFIDFAVGDCGFPKIGVEFMLKPSWSNEETVFDFMKLLDSRNPNFKQVVSFGIIQRVNGLYPDPEYYRRLADAAFTEATQRLAHFYHAGEAEIYFIITEVAVNGRRHFYYDAQTGHFLSTDHLPPFLGGLN